MLNASYAIKRFSEKFQKLTTIKETQALAKSLDVNFSVVINSYTLWQLDWDITNNEVAGSFKLDLTPKFSLWRSNRLRFV